MKTKIKTAVRRKIFFLPNTTHKQATHLKHSVCRQQIIFFKTNKKKSKKKNQKE